VYRYGFNGKENDNSTGEGNLDFGARIMDVRLGRWLSTDIVTKPFISPYNFSSNNPVNYLDPNGEDNIHFYYVVVRQYADGKLITAKTNKFYTVEKTNTANVFVHHKYELRYDGVGSDGKATSSKPSIDTRFYPDVPGAASGLTKSYLGLVKDNDRKTLIKFIDEYGVSKQSVDGDYAEINTPGSSGSKRLQNAQWWGGIFKDKAYQESQNDEQNTRASLAVGVLSVFGGDALLVEKILGKVASAVGSNLVKISEIDGNVMMFSAKIGNETVEGVTNFSLKDGKLFLDKLHLEGSSAGKVGREALWNMGKDLGKQFNVEEVIVQGGRRSTGKYKGTIPSPVKIKVN